MCSSQHDRVFTRDAPMRAVLDIMETDESVACVGFPAEGERSCDKCVKVGFPNARLISPSIVRRTPRIGARPSTQFYDSMRRSEPPFT